MYFSDAIAVVLRRWYIVVIALVVMAVPAALVVAFVPTQYQASGQVLLLPPSSATVPGGPSNPYLNLPSGVTFTATLIASGLTQPSVARELAEQGYASEYSVSVVPNTGPLIIISVKDGNTAAALELRDELISRIEAELTRIQDEEDVPAAQLIASRTFNTSNVAEVLAGSRIRALGAILAVGVILTAVAVFGVERQAARRRDARALHSASNAESDAARADIDSSRTEPSSPVEHDDFDLDSDDWFTNPTSWGSDSPGTGRDGERSRVST